MPRMSQEIFPTAAAPVTFGLVHGAHHNSNVWNKLRPILESMGHNTVAMDLPIDKEGVTFDTYAEHIADSLSGESDIVIVGHSRMGRAICRVPGLMAVQRLVYLNAGIQPALNQKDKEANQPATVTPEYAIGRITVEGAPFVDYDRSRAMIFYSDFDARDPDIEASYDEIRQIIGSLRKQNRSDGAPPLESQPQVPVTSILSTEDRVVSPEYSRYAAINYLGVQALEIPGGHSPFLLRPTMLAKVLNEVVCYPSEY
jgi:pimeloyl-ACP methyl ester carboxylesterase